MFRPPTDVVAGVRIQRRNGKYRQSFRVENANRLARAGGKALPITVSHSSDNSEAADVDTLGGRLKVVTQRDFVAKVPFEMTGGKFSYEDCPDPVNQLGGVFRDNVPVVTSNDEESFLAAFGKRGNFVQVDENDDLDPVVFKHSLTLLRALPRINLPEWEEDEEALDEWYSTFDPSKLARMRAAEKIVHQEDARSLGRKDLSVKGEVLLKRMDPKWAPRIIYAGTDVMNRVTGPAMKAFMARLTAYLSVTQIGPCEVKLCYKTDDVNLCRFAAGLEPTDLPTPSCGDLPQGTLKYTYEGDFSANDREQRSRVALLFDEWLDILRMPQWLRNLFLDMEHFSVQNRRFGMRAQLRYQLPTGTTATTARNSTYNITMFCVAAQRQRIRFARILVLGDDILARTAQKFSVSLWKACVDLFKMVLKGKEPDLEGQATLLSRRLIFDCETPCMMPMIGKALARFNARASVNAQVSDSQYMAGKALSYAYEFRHAPFLRDAFLERYDLEDKAAVTLDDLTWFTRTAGYDSVEKLERMIRTEKVLIDEWDFERWLMHTYMLSTESLSELLQLTVLNRSPDLIEHPESYKLEIDW